MRRTSVERLPMMLLTIASESRTLEEFAKRADAWASSESNRPEPDVLVDAWAARHRRLYGTARVPARFRQRVHAALCVAALARLTKRAKLFDDLIDSVDKERES